MKLLKLWSAMEQKNDDDMTCLLYLYLFCLSFLIQDTAHFLNDTVCDYIKEPLCIKYHIWKSQYYNKLKLLNSKTL